MDRAGGRERPQELFGRLKAQKVGFAPAQPSVFPASKINRRAMRNLLFLGHLLGRQGDREGDAYGDLGISCTRHLPALQMAVETL